MPKLTKVAQVIIRDREFRHRIAVFMGVESATVYSWWFTRAKKLFSENFVTAIHHVTKIPKKVLCDCNWDSDNTFE